MEWELTAEAKKFLESRPITEVAAWAHILGVRLETDRNGYVRVKKHGCG